MSRPGRTRVAFGVALGTARELAVAAALPDGGALVAGGESTASSARTSLAGGVVLVAGGAIDTAATPPATSEPLDPACGGWIAGPDMSTPRVDQAATVLSDGDVLAISGASGVTNGQISTLTPTAEVYAPPSPPLAVASVTAGAGNGSATVVWAPAAAFNLTLGCFLVNPATSHTITLRPSRALTGGAKAFLAVQVRIVASDAAGARTQRIALITVRPAEAKSHGG